MKIWIRSQYKIILLCPNYLFVKVTDIWCRDNSENYKLAAYTSEIRAIEVLDEIQKVIMNKNDNFVYEMPLE